MPCRTGDADAWWPDKRDLDGLAARGAVDAFRTCPVIGACLAYAVAARKPEGIWGGTLPS